MNFRVYFCFILVLGCQGEDITPTPEPPVKAELPDMCRPWRPAPEEFPLPEDEYPVFEGRRDRKICTKRGEAKPGEDPKYENEVTCDLYSSLNLHWFTSEHVYVKNSKGERFPYGSSSGCDRPGTSDEVHCYVDRNDTNSKPLDRVLITCRGDKFCGKAQAADCCKIVSREKPSKERIDWSEEPTQGEIRRWEEERCGRLRNRYITCLPFCTEPDYAEQCSNYWTFMDPRSCETI